VTNLLLDEQARWDEENTNPDWGYTRIKYSADKLTRVHRRIAMTNWPIQQRNSEQVRATVLPHLAIYRSQIMNSLLLDASVVDEKEFYAANAREVALGIGRASSFLAAYLEDVCENPAVSNIEAIRAVNELHFCTRSLANLLDVDSAEAHLQRLEELSPGIVIPQAAPAPIAQSA
jgi:hypothetical protein